MWVSWSPTNKRMLFCLERATSNELDTAWPTFLHLTPLLWRRSDLQYWYQRKKYKKGHHYFRKFSYREYSYSSLNKVCQHTLIMALPQNQGVILPPLTVFVIKSIFKITYNYLINLMWEPISNYFSLIKQSKWYNCNYNIIMMQDYTAKYILIMYFLQNCRS